MQTDNGVNAGLAAIRVFFPNHISPRLLPSSPLAYVQATGSGMYHCPWGNHAFANGETCCDAQHV